MACNTCAKPFSLLRKEKGCPGCGFSYCSKCLVNKIYLPKINSEAKVCAKCKTLKSMDVDKTKKIQPPDAYLRRIEDMNASNNNQNCKLAITKPNINTHDPKDQEILERLQKLRENSQSKPGTSNQEIEERIKNLKGEVKTATDEELRQRLDKLAGYKINSTENKVPTISQNTKTEQEQADDLMKQYLEQTKIDKTYKNEFDEQINKMMSRFQNLKGDETGEPKSEPKEQPSSEDEEDTIRKIVEKLKAESALENQQDTSEIDERNNELPFCEICNEDASRRCLGCRYLFCKRCFNEHKDDDDDCNQYENYTPPKNK